MTRNAELENRDLLIRVEEATERLRAELGWDRLSTKPKTAIVLGSGLGAFTESLTERVVVPYKKIPHLKSPSVPGHEGQWVLGQAKGHTLLAAQGRLHVNEGHTLTTITLPVRVMKALGIQHLILTNAAGSVNPEYRPGDFMLLEDHINFAQVDPLCGLLDERLGTRFVDLSEVYSRDTNNALFQRTRRDKPDWRLHRGVYAFVPGPQYETPAEIRMLHQLGIDAVGMSTIPEAIVAKSLGMTVHGVSCITNLGAGLSRQPLNHHEVSEQGKTAAPKFQWLIEQLLGLF